MRVRLVILAAIVALFVVPMAAFASWSTPGTGSGYGKAHSMAGGNTPTTSVSGRNVTVSWTATGGSVPVTGYIVKRYDTSNGLQAIGSACSGTVTGTSCTEAGVPAGTWKYSVTPANNNWRGAESAQSTSVTVAAASMTLTPTTITSLPATLTGSISGFVSGQTVTYRLDNPNSGTVLSGSINPSPVQTNGTATASVTIPSGTSNGSHTVYAVGSSGDIASVGISVQVCTSPGNQTINSDADSYVKQDAATSNFGTATAMDVKADSSGTKVRRSLVHFTLPSIPQYCSVTAAHLRLFASTGATGRTLAAYQAAASWTEAGVTWNNQPATTGTAATAASVATGSTVDWTVTSLVQTFYSGTNTGFIVKDANEASGTTTQSFSTREASTNKPQLVITFG